MALAMQNSANNSIQQQASKQNAAENTMNVDKFIGDILSDLRENKLELPTLPQVAAKINHIVSNPRSRAKDVAQIVCADPALSAKLLQVANSPMMRGDKNIDNIQTSITRMGTNMVRNVVTSFLVKQLFSTKVASLQKRMTAIWTHSAHVAAICHVLASRFSTLPPDEIMLTGLLHDIGKLPILAKAKELPNLQANEKTLDCVIEKLHCPLGKAILQAWNFQPAIVQAAGDHENLRRNSAELDHTDIVLIANLHSHMGKPSAKKVDWTQIPAFAKMDLDPETSIGVLEEARDEIKEIQKILAT